MAGIEFNKDGYTRKTSAHLLGLDLTQPIDPALDLPETIHRIHAQGGLAVASHPHIMKSQWGRNTLYLWENQERYAPLDMVIPGWVEGIQLMTEGEKVRFWIPEKLAYKGAAGLPAGMLVFDVELIKIR